MIPLHYFDGRVVPAALSGSNIGVPSKTPYTPQPSKYTKAISVVRKRGHVLTYTLNGSMSRSTDGEYTWHAKTVEEKRLLRQIDAGGSYNVNIVVLPDGRHAWYRVEEWASYVARKDAAEAEARKPKERDRWVDQFLEF